MPFDRRDRFVPTLQKYVATFLEQAFSGDTIITVTRISVSKDLRKATIFVSIYPSERAQVVFEKIKGRARELRSYVKSHLESKIVPFFDFELDKGEENRQRVEELFRDLE